MAKARHIIVLGLGTFGGAVAASLAGNGCRVTGVDRRRDRVEELKDTLYAAVIADVTDRAAIEPLAVKDADAVVISLGSDISVSLLATLHVKELGQDKIIVKGVSREHAKLLQHLKVDRVVFPELEFASVLADQLTWPSLLERMKFGADYAMVEVATPESWVGQTLQQIDVRRRYNVLVVGTKDALTNRVELPSPELRLSGDQSLLLVGRQEDLKKLVSAM